MNLSSDAGSFSINDIKNAYNIGGIYERNGVTCNEVDIANAWLKADKYCRDIKWM